MVSKADESAIEFTLAGNLVGHNDWITSISTGNPQKENEDPNVLITGSRDKSLMIWKLQDFEGDDTGDNSKKYAGLPVK
jgi:guanine nucleotide-binding protein subunit beta-2-like 1 protein